VVLADELGRHPEPAEAFAAFEQRRIKRVHFVVNSSWKLGKVAQMSNPLLVSMRNTLLRLMPESVNEHQMKSLLTVDF
jgi:2-polyprenyl-6-methoxyphenol hydroxylase-like FAD-dependent oxidoreductase